MLWHPCQRRKKNEAPPYRNYGSIFSRVPTGRRPERHAARLRLRFTGETPRGDFSVDFLSEKDNPCYGVFSVLKYGQTPFGIWRTRIGKWRPPSRSRRERLTAERSRPEMAPQRFEKIESAPGNGMGSEASNLQHLVRERAADRALRRIVSDRRLRPSGHSSRIRSAGRPMGNFPPRNPLKSLKTGKDSEAPTARGHGLRIRRARRPREKEKGA